MKKTLTTCLLTAFIGMSSLAMASPMSNVVNLKQGNVVTHSWDLDSGYGWMEPDVERAVATVRIRTGTFNEPIMLFYRSTGLNSGARGTVFPFLGLNLYQEGHLREPRNRYDWYVKPPFYINQMNVHYIYNYNILKYIASDREKNAFIQNLKFLVKEMYPQCEAAEDPIYCYLDNNENIQHLLVRFGTLKMAEVSYEFGGGLWDNPDEMEPLIIALRSYFIDRGDREGSLDFGRTRNVIYTGGQGGTIHANRDFDKYGFNYDIARRLFLPTGN